MSPISDAIDTKVVSIVHLWTIQDGRVRRVKYKGHDGRVRNIHHLLNEVGYLFWYFELRVRYRRKKVHVRCLIS